MAPMSERPQRVRVVPGPDGWQLVGLTTSAQLAQRLRERLVEKIGVDELPAEEPVVGHVEADGCWLVFVKEAGETSLDAVLLTTEQYRLNGFDPYLVGATQLESGALVNLVEQGSVRTRDLEGRTDKLGIAYALFLAGDAGVRSPVYSSVAGEPEQAGDTAWADVQLLKVDRPAGAGADGRPVPGNEVRLLEQRLSDVEQALKIRTRLLVAAVLVAALLPLLFGFQVWSQMQGEMARLAEEKVDRSVFIDGFYLRSDGEVSVEDALLAKLNDLATVSVQSGAWQSGLRSRGVEPAELIDTLVAVSANRSRLISLARTEPALSALAKVQQPLSSLAAAEPALTSLASAEPPLTRLAAAEAGLTEVAGVSEALTGLADQETQLVDLAGHGPALVSIAEVAEPLTTMAGYGSALAQLQQQREALLALAGQRKAIESQLQHAATLGTMVNEMARVLTFMEQRQPDLEQLARRKEALLALTEQRHELSALVVRSAALTGLGDASRPLLDLANDIHLRRLVDNDKSLDVISDHLDELAQLSLHARALLALIDPGSGPG